MFKPTIKIFFRKKKNQKFQEKLEAILGYYPRDEKLYRTAFAHKSAFYKLDDGLVVNNERLEYLGDAILDAIVAEYLFKRYIKEDEGFLTKMRSKIVKRKNLDQIALMLGIQGLIFYKGIGNNYKHICGNAFEALVGAVYLDKGYKKTRKFIVKRIISKYLDIEALLNEDSDYKSRLIEWGQKVCKEIVFETSEKYTDKDKNPYFGAVVSVGGNIISEGLGRSKKEAEQQAAENALEKIEKDNLH